MSIYTYIYHLDRVLETPKKSDRRQQIQRLKQSGHKMAQLITLTLTEKQRSPSQKLKGRGEKQAQYKNKN